MGQQPLAVISAPPMVYGQPPQQHQMQPQQYQVTHPLPIPPTPQALCTGVTNFPHFFRRSLFFGLHDDPSVASNDLQNPKQRVVHGTVVPSHHDMNVNPSHIPTFTPLNEQMSRSTPQQQILPPQRPVGPPGPTGPAPPPPQPMQAGGLAAPTGYPGQTPQHSMYSQGGVLPPTMQAATGSRLPPPPPQAQAPSQVCWVSNRKSEACFCVEDQVDRHAIIWC